MLMTMRMKKRKFSVEDFNYTEVLDSRDKCFYRWTLYVVDKNDIGHHYKIAYYENIFEIIDAVIKDISVIAVRLSDYDTHKHYYRINDGVMLKTGDKIRTKETLNELKKLIEGVKDNEEKESAN